VRTKSLDETSVASIDGTIITKPITCYEEIAIMVRQDPGGNGSGLAVQKDTLPERTGGHWRVSYQDQQQSNYRRE